MTDVAFTMLVHNMRTAQQGFFATRAKHVLVLAKKLEREVDAEVGRRMREWEERRQELDAERTK